MIYATLHMYFFARGRLLALLAYANTHLRGRPLEYTRCIPGKQKVHETIYTRKHNKLKNACLLPSHAKV